MAGREAHPLPASIAAAAGRFANIQSLNDDAFELLTDSTLFNLKLAINPIDHRRMGVSPVPRSARMSRPWRRRAHTSAAQPVRRQTLTNLAHGGDGPLMTANSPSLTTSAITSATNSVTPAGDLASTYYGGPAIQKDFANQIFSSQLFANQNHDARETFFAIMPAQLLARLCLFNTSRQSADKYYAPPNAAWRRRAWRSR